MSRLAKACWLKESYCKEDFEQAVTAMVLKEIVIDDNELVVTIGI